MFYIVEVEYVGPDQSKLVDPKRFEIRTEPGRLNLSREVCLDGWLGTTNDWCEYAHGAFETFDDARNKIIELCGDDGYRIRETDPHEPFALLPGQYWPMGRIESQNWCYASMRGEIKAHFTDSDIEDWFDRCQHDAMDEGYSLDRDAVIEMATEYCDELNEDDDDV